MLGTIVNALSIFFGSLIGFLLRGGIPEKINNTIMQGLALCVMLIGASGALKFDNLLLAILSVVIGAIIGEVIDIDERLKRLGDNIERNLKGRGGKVSEGFVSASLLFCVGAMAVVGSLESGLKGNHEILFAKSILDGVSSIVFTSSMGIGVALSSISVFIYQGIITIASSFLKDILVSNVIADMTAAGSLLIIGIGLNMMGIGKIKVANLLPAVFIPVIYHIIYSYIINLI
ncbi:DUF554 domain-containing protein [Fonticella tunisiensis]|uniref:Membrane protein YdfK n=1 Tax=Fonticella tunisiensis TaxID=1096341 RepID=A0A4R7KQX8_9CLOT|nr:DUF554 domain-containing protein [Fonticella tunisiensis]TDT61084.1 hypothetical protein EDD71_10999 [Fonticella tunisiensis]